MSFRYGFTNKILILALVSILCLCCLNSAFAADDAENKSIESYLSSDLPYDEGYDALKIDISKNIGIDDQSILINFT
ncbi:MAG: hypothetical protein Q4Q24_04000 [Methanobrevibacter ruminantium]|uniref:hypothetical protein n=1 Tax=Methanobrevibacter ruminantium TaxID=83816 RepID=UPI0026EAADFC|nr:hypothetical protein [Methanobrevibacter ruminantium]MDO5842408.1 hypothetical protein [Methanobrevibacter ruminantium]